MLLKKIMTVAMVMGSLIVGAIAANANTGAQNQAQTHYGVSVSCSICHTSAPALNATFGADYKAAGGTGSAAPTNWTTFDALDSDGDGVTNGQEFIDGTDPSLAPGQTAAATKTASVTGCMTDSVATPFMMFLALLSIGFLTARKKD